MRGVPGWALKAGAVGLTIAATVASASYVGSHVKNHAAPLRPSLRPASAGQAQANPGVQGASVAVSASQPITQTYVS